jgi:hypothetical protein
VSRSARLDASATVLYVLALASTIVGLFYRPFLFGPVGTLFVLVGLVSSTKHQRLGRLAIGAVGLGWLIGASIAIWYSNPLY